MTYQLVPKLQPGNKDRAHPTWLHKKYFNLISFNSSYIRKVAAKVAINIDNTIFAVPQSPDAVPTDHAGCMTNNTAININIRVVALLILRLYLISIKYMPIVAKCTANNTQEKVIAYCKALAAPGPLQANEIS
ncbi:MAG: hypothetical protein OEV42_03355 [Deltaproteobacteria bacterium]|nr:hypothetical protein [Deltaproteobacteria bacterium]